MTKSLVVPQPLAASPSMPDPCSTPSTKQPAGPVGDIHDGDDLPPYLVRFDPRVAKKIQRYGIENEDFNPRIATMIADLESDPKSYPKKRDKLAEARAYSLQYRGATWRAIFLVEDDFSEVFVASFAPHDEAYNQAEQRL